MSNKFFNLFIILLFYQYIHLINTSYICPPDLILKPCYCRHGPPLTLYSSPTHYYYGNYGPIDVSIECSNIYDSSFDLRAVFLKLSSYSNIILNDDENATHFNYFILSNTTITSIPEDVFVDITFKSLLLRDNIKLTTIDQNAFSHGKDYVESFETANTSLSDSSGIFSILRQFKNLRHVNMQNDQIKSIPSYAFDHTYLSDIYFGYDYPRQTQPIESIGDYAFYNTSNLHVLHIFSPKLIKITKYALAQRNEFVLNTRRSVILEISIGGENLNPNSFELTSLSHFRSRSVFLHFYDTNITYLDENIFQPFLAANPFSVIDIGPTNTLFECDCRSAWIQLDYLRNVNQLEHRVYGYECSRYDFDKYCTANN